MAQFFIHPQDISNGTAKLSGGEAKHLVRVLRHRIGDHIWFSDGVSKQYEGKIISITSHEVQFAILQTRELQKQKNPPTMAMAILKGDRWDWAIQKVVELGCPHILPFFSTRTIPQFDEEAVEKKRIRWERIALEAAKQSGLPQEPKVDLPKTWEELLQSFSQYQNIVMPWEGEKKYTLQSALETNRSQKTLIVIGPEGGFTDEEAMMAKEKGGILVSLGSQILRSETASIVTLALYQFTQNNI